MLLPAQVQFGRHIYFKSRTGSYSESIKNYAQIENFNSGFQAAPSDGTFSSPIKQTGRSSTFEVLLKVQRIGEPFDKLELLQLDDLVLSASEENEVDALMK